MDAEINHPVRLTGHQVRMLDAFMGGDYTTDVTLMRMPRRAIEYPNGGVEIIPAGLYVWCTERPEDGAVLLPERAGDADEDRCPYDLACGPLAP